MSDLPQISDAEWDVMEVLWVRRAATANQVVQDLAGRKAWRPRTVKTLLNRLVRKSALSFRRQGREYLYRPAFPRDRYVRRESQTFLQRVFAGCQASMLVHMIDSARLSRREILELRKILDAKKGD